MLTKLRKFKSRPGFYVMKLLGRFDSIRWMVSHLASHGPRPKWPLLDTSVFSSVDPEVVARELRTDGISLHVNLPKTVTSEIYRYAMTNPCYGNYDPAWGFYYSNRHQAESILKTRFVTASYFNTSRCAAIKCLANDAKLWAIASSYLGVVPYYLGTSMWWSFPGERTTKEQNFFAQQFHFDLDDYKFLKFFFYISDVDEDAGPHVFVRQSHIRKRWNWRMHVRRHTDDAISQFYGDENILTLTGEAGTGFAEDTYGIHKGTSPTRKPRLILQLQFGLFDYGVQHDDRDPQLLRQVA